MPQNPQPVELTLSNGKKIKFTQFGRINFGEGVKSVYSLTEQERRKIENMYRAIGADIQRKIVTLKRSPDTATNALKKMQLEDLKQSINDNLYEITQGAQTMTLNNMSKTSEAVTKDMTAWLNSYGIEVKTSFAHVPQDVISNIVSGRLYGKDWNFSRRIWGDYNKSVSDITQIVAEGIAQNKPTYDIAKALEQYVSPNAAKPWDWSKVYPGSKKKVDYNAQRLARTMINHAYQQSIVEVSKTNPFVRGIEWRAAFTKTTCEICEALNGQIFPVDQVPLDHPNGKCTFVAAIDKSPKEIADSLIDWYNGNADDDFNAKMDIFAEKAGFTKDDINISKLQKVQQTGKPEEKPKEKKKTYTINNIKNKMTEYERDENLIQNFMSNFKAKTQEQKEFIARFQKLLPGIHAKDTGRAHFNPNSRMVFFSLKADEKNICGQYDTFYHEYGHFIDNCLHTISADKNFGKTYYALMQEDFKNIKAMCGNNFYAEFGTPEKIDKTSGIQDMIDGLSGGTINIKWGHGKDYWERQSIDLRWTEITSEAFANMTSAFCSSDPSEDKYMQQYFPKSYDYFKSEIVKGGK